MELVPCGNYRPVNYHNAREEDAYLLCFDCVPVQYNKALKWIKDTWNRERPLYRLRIPCDDLYRSFDLCDWKPLNVRFTGELRRWPVEHEFDIERVTDAVIAKMETSATCLRCYQLPQPDGLSVIQKRAMALSHMCMSAICAQLEYEFMLPPEVARRQLLSLCEGNDPHLVRKGDTFTKTEPKLPFLLANGPFPLCTAKEVLIAIIHGEDLPYIEPRCPPYRFASDEEGWYSYEYDDEDEKITPAWGCDPSYTKYMTWKGAYYGPTNNDKVRIRPEIEFEDGTKMTLEEYAVNWLRTRVKEMTEEKAASIQKNRDLYDFLSKLYNNITVEETGEDGVKEHKRFFIDDESNVKPTRLKVYYGTDESTTNEFMNLPVSMIGPEADKELEDENKYWNPTEEILKQLNSV